MWWLVLLWCLECFVGGEEDVLSYLRAVYPAAVIERENAVALFESLDYYYVPLASRYAAMSPALVVKNAPMLPYVPAGAYYSAEASSSDELFELSHWTSGSSFTRWKRPVRVFAEKPDTYFHSSNGTRIGPAPSWTNPLAIVRYPLFPLGLVAESDKERPVKAPVGVFSPAEEFFFFEKDALTNIVTLKKAKSASASFVAQAFVEVEQFGGPSWVNDCSKTAYPCGTWANAWRGTGIFMKIDNAFVSRSKATAIGEMLALMGDDERVDDLAKFLGLNNDLSNHDQTSTTKGAVLGMLLFSLRGPCAQVPGFENGGSFETEPLILRAKHNDIDPLTFVESLSTNLTLSTYWILGVCGFGERSHALKEPFASFDDLLLILSCYFGFQAVLLDRSPNDNGLFHQEVIDYDFPKQNAWPTFKENNNTSLDKGFSFNPTSVCLPPFRLAKKQPNAKPPPGGTIPRDATSLLDYWKLTNKFSLRDPFSSSPPKPCHLDAEHTITSIDDCRATRLQSTSHQLHRSCYLRCQESMSLVHANVTDTHLFNADRSHIKITDPSLIPPRSGPPPRKKKKNNNNKQHHPPPPLRRGGKAIKAGSGGPARKRPPQQQHFPRSSKQQQQKIHNN